ncbi:MAG: ATP-binding protein [Fulvivirga sp.]
MNKELKILIIEDSEDDYDLLLRALRKGGFIVAAERVETPETLEQSLLHHWDLIISDNSLPRLDAATALRITRSTNQNVPFLIVSGTIGEEAAVNAMRVGANDYILKDNLKRLIPAIERELKEAQNRLKAHSAEGKLAKSRRMYQFLSGSIKDSFIALNQQLNIIHCNSAAKKEFHFTKKHLGTNIFSLFPEWKGGKIERKINNVEAKTKSEHISFEYESKEFFEGNIYPSEEGLSIILRKVTEKKRAEKNLLQLNHELETLMYRISHDLKGPVSSIMGLINIGRIDFQEPKFKPYLGMLDKSAHTLKNTLEELLNITRIKQGDIMAEKVMLEEVINDVTEGIKYNEGFEEVEIKLDLTPQHYIYTDRRLMMSIFHNLLDNSIKYKKTSSNIKSWISITADKRDYELHVHVKDNGSGIEAKFQDKVFDMFYRAHEFSSGSGLGLYIVKNAVDKICGSIKLESTKGEGTSFDIIIPTWNKKIALQ